MWCGLEASISVQLLNFNSGVHLQRYNAVHIQSNQIKSPPAPFCVNASDGDDNGNGKGYPYSD